KVAAHQMEHNGTDESVEQASVIWDELMHNSESLDQWKKQMSSLTESIGELERSHHASISQTNFSLDPEDWPSARIVAHKMLDASLDYIQSIRDQPVWQPIPDDVREVLQGEQLPEQGQPLSDVCHDVFTNIVPYTYNNAHPCLWGWANGEGTFGNVVADMITAAINVNCITSNHSASIVERTIINWMRQIFGFPETDDGGLMVTGTSIGTIISIATARQRALVNIRQDGLVNGSQLITYTSIETHGCVVKALELLGFGSKSLHLVPVDNNFCIKIDDLKTAIQDDRDNGLIPFCIVGNAGTVNTGAFDNFLALSSIARTENMWFHVDGAFGSWSILDPIRRHLMTGIELADSLAFDFHKWLHCSYEAGCVLIRDGALLRSTFSTNHAYFSKSTTLDHMNNGSWFCDLGPDLSRSFRALRVWFTFKSSRIVRWLTKHIRM
ncbi:unnamed protein product, partial [Rotaria magnacalcarata]